MATSQYPKLTLTGFKALELGIFFGLLPLYAKLYWGSTVTAFSSHTSPTIRETHQLLSSAHLGPRACQLPVLPCQRGAWGCPRSRERTRPGQGAQAGPWVSRSTEPCAQPERCTRIWHHLFFHFSFSLPSTTHPFLITLPLSQPTSLIS